MQLRSGLKKNLFFTPTGKSSPSAVRYGTPVLSVREQLEMQTAAQERSRMAENVNALSRCLETTEAKVTRIREAITTAQLDHRKFSVHALKLYLKTTDSAYEEYNGFQNRIYLSDPARKEEFEPNFIEFEELYEFTRIALCEMLQAYEDEEKAALAVAAQAAAEDASASALKTSSLQPGGSSSGLPIAFPPTLVLQQVALPTFDGSYDNWFKFKQMFCDIADKCTADSAATKLHFLDKALIGKAQGAIDQQIIRDNDYQAAWHSLTQQFENLPALINDTTMRLLNVKPIVNESYAQLKCLLDDIEKCVSSLEYHNLKMDSLSEAIITTLIASKLDMATRKVWESSVTRGQLPEYKKMISVLRNQQAVLERCERAKPVVKTRSSNSTFRTQTPSASTKIHTATVGKKNETCALCTGEHQVEKCDVFLKLNVNARYGKAKHFGLCFRCLKRGHRTADCKAEKKCSECSRAHHSLMHPESKIDPEKPIQKTAVDATAASNPVDKKESASTASTNCSLLCNATETKNQVLLATAIVSVIDACGIQQKCRALLDSGAMANFISQRFADLLNLEKKPANVPVVGVNGMKTVVKFKVHAQVKSTATEYDFSMDYLVVPKVTGTLPSERVNAERWPIPENVKLADSSFHEPSRIDLLIGAEVFFGLLRSGKITMAADLSILQESALGWLVSGRITECQSTGTVRVCHVQSTQAGESELSGLLRQFWSIDEQDFPSTCQSASMECEQHFQRTHARSESGRYVVRLPFRTNVAELGESRQQAEKRFFGLERRLDKNPDLKQQYKAFIEEYISLGHARVVDEVDEGVFYLPHHCVLKPDSSTTKLRVVFDASARSSTNLSLNDVMMIGPTVQRTLFDIVLRFRCHRYAFTADVPKMYRQVMVHEDDRKYQTIVWRDDRQQPLKTIELSTVTYGTAAAPFLVTRSLNQLALDEQQDFPEASDTVLNSFYVDDALAGADSLIKAQKLQSDLIEMLSRGGFQLHKWCANDAALLQNIPAEGQAKELNFESCKEGETVKTLGLLWNPVNDVFEFRVEPIKPSTQSPTKRLIMSDIARLFDPLGYLGPAVIIAKLLMQQLWMEKVGWDDPVTEEVLETWQRFRTELCEKSDLKIPRPITVNNVMSYEIHGFADASMKAYGCCVYLRCLKIDGTAEMSLLCGKSRVTPVKELNRQVNADEKLEQMTIPRLELCAAKLLAEQVTKVLNAIQLEISSTVLWTDAKIVLAWIDRLKPDAPVFVRNRVTAIQQLSGRFEWRHVSTALNPADHISRGLYPVKLMKCALWWRGPEFLRTRVDAVLPQNEEDDVDHIGNDGVEIDTLTVTVDEKTNAPLETINRCSDYRKLQRTFGYVARFLHNCRSKIDKRQGVLNVIDLREAELLVVRVVQFASYGEEIRCILKEHPVKGKLRNLNPVFDKVERTLRVGGRIRHSDLPREQKHPLILPEGQHLTEILIDSLHRENLHVGRNGLLSVIRSRFWPINAKRVIYRVLKRCVRCFRVKPSDIQQFMGDLPSCRVTEALPFSRTGVDYAGPLLLKQGRMKSPVKAYIALFVCMTTKALHLELVTSLSTDAFLAALHRFVGRRGNVSEMRSDRGTNFVGGNRQLKDLYDVLASQLLQRKISEFCQVRGIDWKFNLPKAPHQGGLWEAGVKSVKHHLHRVLKEAYLNYEEMNTLLVQIEAILNSRPLCQQTDDPCDYQALSPAHFLIGRELTAVAEPSYDGLRENTLSRYQLVQKHKQAFWRRWSNDYITEQQRRGKWNRSPSPIKDGMLVILKEDNTPPQTWRLGRIIRTYPGSDGVVRVVTIRTSSGATFDRPTTQIAILPIVDNETGNED